MWERRQQKYISLLLIVSIVMTLLPVNGQIYAAMARADDIEVQFGAGTTIGNTKYEATNAFVNFNNNRTEGFEHELKSGTNIDWIDGSVFAGANGGSADTFVLDVSKNATLRDLAQSGHAKLKIGFSGLAHYEGSFMGFTTWTRVSDILITHFDGKSTQTIIEGRNLGARAETITITPESVITITVGGEKDDKGPTGVRGLYMKFEDKERPVMEGYTFTGDGNERNNAKINQMELYVKQQEHITLAYNFSEPVRPTAISANMSDHFLRHPLFTNPDGTGLPAAGEQMYLTNLSYNANNLKTLQKDIVYQYVGSRYHNSGNNPIEPRITGEFSGSLIDQSMEQKFYGAVMADAAGNVASTDFPNRASLNSNVYLKGKTVNPFDYRNGGYRVIIDGVAPKYTKSGNGITPEIVTGVTLNDNDVIEFTIKFTEEAMIKEGWNVNDTFIHLNNGLKAKYTGGQNTDTWTFRVEISEGLIEETPLLKVISLTNESKPGYSDKDVISDYAGNLLIQPANLLGEHTDGDTSLVNSTIDWAQLGIDNTPPEIGFRYEADGATDNLYRKNGKVTIDANDATLKIPQLDPLTAVRGEERPSQGIYRPSNMTGGASPSVGLVYYYWSQNADDPFLGKESDQWAAIKRYSLSAKQPSEDLYPEGFENVQLQVANNKTNMIAPPAEALAANGSGIWYLHAWTADMSWDSARELMQYEKRDNFKEQNEAQYKAWKEELPSGSSEADRIFYADNKALAAVGQYGDMSLWPLSDFKQVDSNWTYNVTPIAIDNKGPDITFSEYSGDGTMNVELTTNVADPHSGIDKVTYQWVAAGAKPNDIDWKPVTLAGGSFLTSTQNEVFEDGEYELYVQAEDKAGNVSTQRTSKVAVVNSEASVVASFDPDADTGYAQSHDVDFQIDGITPDKVAYAFGDSSIRPTSESKYTELQEVVDPSSPSTHHYVIPSSPDKQGTQYIHVMAKAGDRYYYYAKAYYFDNTAPEVTFSKNGVAYPLESHDVIVTVKEPLSTDGLTKSYLWVKDGEAAPAEDDASWQDLPASGKVTIDNAALQSGDIADYRLFVKAVDGAGNSVITSTSDMFKVSKAGDDNTPPAESTARLIDLYGDDTDGYTAVIELALDTIDKRGYEYSLSPDKGTSWMKWRPYTNFVSVKVSTNNLAELGIQVKFKTPGGVIGEAKTTDISSLGPTAPVYALASLNKLNPINSVQGVEIQITPPLGVKVTPSATNPQVPVRKGNVFTVRMNGYYSFDLVDLNDPTRTATLYAVVNNIDDTAPQGTIEYRITERTSGNVPVQLASTSEPVVILNNAGQSTFVFTENGSFTFMFRDEAGNMGSATATVANIDKSSPKVKIVRSYAYGTNNSETFGTIEDNGNVVLASGVKLEVVKDDNSDKTIRVIGGDSSVVVEKNGTVSFTVADEYGNTTVVKTEVDNVASDAIAPETISYAFVDEAGNPIPDQQIVTINGEQYAKGRMKVTLSGKLEAPNKVFAGVKPIMENGAYTNQISGDDGTYSYARVFSANGTTQIGISDLLGRTSKVAVTVKGLDNKAPELTLNQASSAVIQNKADFKASSDLGGYTVSDDVSAADRTKVELSGLDLTKLGRQTVTYTATDEVGNTTSVTQDVVVVAEAGMRIFANGTLLSSASGESALFNTNKLTFSIQQFNTMAVGGQEMVNAWGTYDLYYYSGLFREGQMKLIATKLTYAQLTSGQFKVVFPKTGWYTIVLRNQERERVFTTFFVGRIEP
ncbi:hypothetical protein FHS18_006035 [Paenibacillus phyllosphaerae]|uniref:HYR domain-containing protein n=1 Tax=Paenibacillus phyllosphaerae TaxID=274593 RepID=A0A7W5FQX3_9BACL|nr:hypothetical protein [Paenibacillus phyllosphaerae]MBB3113920.1 hypothetical protein [Paenibacillus phyllosphaerae]